MDHQSSGELCGEKTKSLKSKWLPRRWQMNKYKRIKQLEHNFLWCYLLMYGSCWSISQYLAFFYLGKIFSNPCKFYRPKCERLFLQVRTTRNWRSNDSIQSSKFQEFYPFNSPCLNISEIPTVSFWSHVRPDDLPRQKWYYWDRQNNIYNSFIPPDASIEITIFA